MRYRVLGLGFFLVAVAVAQTVSVDELDKFQSNDVAAGDFFGRSVAFDGSQIFVGASSDDDTGVDAGSVYVFDWDGVSATQVAKFQSGDVASGDGFGSAVAVFGSEIVVGAFEEDLKGSVYVFDWDGAVATQVAKFQSNDLQGSDEFGRSVAFDGSQIFVGAVKEDDTASDAGSVYVFDWDGAAATQVAKFQSNDVQGSDQFGSSLALVDSELIVGASREGTGGSVYVFDWDGAAATQVAKFQSNDVAAVDLFGRSVAFDGSQIFVGAELDDDTASDAGSVYVFDWNGVSATQVGKFQSGDIASDDRFGHSLSLVGTEVVVGALQDDDTASNAGSVYVYDFLFDDAEEVPTEQDPGFLFGDDGIFYGGDKEGLAGALQVSTGALDALYGFLWVFMMGLIGFTAASSWGAVAGGGAGAIVAFAFGLFPVWILFFAVFMGVAGFLAWRRNG